MELQTVGGSAVNKGQLLTLYVEDPTKSNGHYFMMLYVKETFNVSIEMAGFYQQLSSENRLMSSEAATEQFYLYLLRKGLVERPKSDVIYMGEMGRPSVRVSDEYKYSLNPTEYTIRKLKNDLMFQSMTFYNHQGYRVMLLGPEGSLSEIMVEIIQHGESVGTIRLGIVFDRSLDAVINEADIEQMRSVIMRMVSETSHIPDVTIGRICIILADLVT